MGTIIDIKFAEKELHNYYNRNLNYKIITKRDSRSENKKAKDGNTLVKERNNKRQHKT